MEDDVPPVLEQMKMSERSDELFKTGGLFGIRPAFLRWDAFLEGLPVNTRQMNDSCTAIHPLFGFVKGVVVTKVLK